MATDNTAPGRDVAPDAVPAVHVSQLVKRYGDMVAPAFSTPTGRKAGFSARLGRTASARPPPLNAISRCSPTIRARSAYSASR